MILNILKSPDTRLRKKAKSIKIISNEIKVLANDMIETMYAHNGIGLAATQVNKHVRLVVMDLSETQNDPMIFINPVIASSYGKITSEEGCLSVVGERANIERAEAIIVTCQDIDGNILDFTGTGLISICMQHEIDHLDGILFIDHIDQ